MNSVIRPSDNSDVNYVEYRSKLYFNRFHYKININAPHIRLCKSSNTTLKKFKIGLIRSYLNMPDFLETAEDMYTQYIGIVQKIEELKKVLGKDLQIRREWDSISIFLNDPTVVKQYTGLKLDYIRTFYLNKIQGDSVIYFKKPPRYRYRAYLSGAITPDVVEQLRAFTDLYQNQINLNTVFKRLFKKNNYYLYGTLNNCAFDFDEIKLVTLLNLTMSGHVKQVFELQQLV